MAYNRENYLRIKEEFAHRHDDRVAEAEERTVELEAQLPELREINTALRRRSFAVCHAERASRDPTLPSSLPRYVRRMSVCSVPAPSF